MPAGRACRLHLSRLSQGEAPEPEPAHPMSVAFPLPRQTRRSDYVANGAQTVFGPTGWIAFDLLDVRVRQRAAGAARFTTLTSGFTVALSATPGQVTVTFAAAPAAGATVRVEGARVHARTTDVTRAGALQSSLVEREADLQTVVLQELRRDIDTVAADIEPIATDAAALSAAVGSAGASAGAAATAASQAQSAVASVAISTFDTIAALNAATVQAGVNVVAVRERTTGSGAGGGTLRSTSATHPWTTTSNGGARRWEFMPPTVTPEQGGFTDLQAAITSFNTLPLYTEMYLDRRARTTTIYPPTWSAKISGPGMELVSFLGTEQRVGDDLTLSQAVNNPQRILQNARKAINASRPAELSCELIRTSAQSIPNGVYTALIGTDYRDRCGGIEPSSLGAVFIRLGWRRVRVTGKVTWAINGTNVRQVALALGGANVDLVNLMPVTVGGIVTDQVFNFVADVTAGQLLDVRVWQGTGAALDVLNFRYAVEVIEYDMPAPRGERGLIFQGSWTAIEASAGGFDGLALYLGANKDVFILSGIETYNDDFFLFAQTPKKMWFNCVGPWSFSTAYTVGQRVHSQAENLMFICQVGHTSPGSGTFAAYRTANPTHWRAAVPGDFPQVQSLGYARMRRLIREIKRINPNAEVWGYVSAASDCPYWDAGGNPQVGFRPLSMAIAGGNLNNVSFLVQQWTKGGLDIDGIFFDHAEATFIDATVLDNAISVCTNAGLPVAHNITFPGATQVQFITKSGQARPGHMWVVEGFARDGGVDTTTQTNAMLTEIARHRGRHIRLFAAVEEAAPFFGNVGTPGNGTSYSQTGTVVTVTTRNIFGSPPTTPVNHTMSIGDTFFLDALSGALASGVYTVTSATTTTFAFTAASNQNTTGACDVFTHGLSRLAMNYASNNANIGKSLFDSFKRSGDAFQYSRTSYDTFN